MGTGWGLSSYFIQHFLGMEGNIQRQASAKSPQATPLSFPKRWPWAVGAASVQGGGLDKTQSPTSVVVCYKGAQSMYVCFLRVPPPHPISTPHQAMVQPPL